jgi:hypothetical protein
MTRRSLSLLALLVLVSIPMSASQFIELPFDRVARESAYVVRGEIGQTWSAWDDAHEVIFTYATVRVTRYFGESTGPDTLVIREAGGTVEGYTQEAVGFPVIRAGENVVLMLSKWEGAAEYRIHAFNQGKYLVRERDGVEMLFSDPVQQGHERLERGGRETANAEAPEVGLAIDEFAKMVEDARAGHEVRAIEKID